MSKIIPVDENLDIFSLKVGDVILRKIPSKDFVNFGIICKIYKSREYIKATIRWKEDGWACYTQNIDDKFCGDFCDYVIIPTQ